MGGSFDVYCVLFGSTAPLFETPSFFSYVVLFSVSCQCNDWFVFREALRGLEKLCTRSEVIASRSHLIASGEAMKNSKYHVWLGFNKKPKKSHLTHALFLLFKRRRYFKWLRYTTTSYKIMGYVCLWNFGGWKWFHSFLGSLSNDDNIIFSFSPFSFSEIDRSSRIASYSWNYLFDWRF